MSHSPQRWLAVAAMLASGGSTMLAYQLMPDPTVLTLAAPSGFSGMGEPTQTSGRMFWFMRKKFFGSYFALTCWSRR